MQDTRGAVYVATGDDFVEEAKASATSLKDNMDIPATLFAHTDMDVDIFNEVETIPEPNFGFKDKVYAMKHAPYDRNLYMDTDTFVCSEINDIFDILDEFDLAAAHAVTRWTGGLTENPKKPGRTVDGIPRSFPMYSTGVMVFNNNREVKSLFTKWQIEYDEAYHGDQPAFRRVIYNSDVRIGTLLPSYNYVAKHAGYSYGEVKIIHHRLLDIDSPGASKLISVRDFQEKINENLGERVTYGRNGEIRLAHHQNPSPAPGLIHRAKSSIKNDGIMSTINKGMRIILN